MSTKSVWNLLSIVALACRRPITSPPISPLINFCLHERPFLPHYIFNIIPNYRGDKSSPKRHRSQWHKVAKKPARVAAPWR